MNAPGPITVIWWLRRDLRLADNVALVTAMASADALVPVFILDPGLLHSAYVGQKRLGFLFGALRDLDNSLRSRGSRLIVRQGRPIEVLRTLLAESGATQIVAESDYSAYATRRDSQIRRELPLHLVGSPSIRPPETVLKQDGDPYTVFTPFSKTWLALPLPHPTDLLETPAHIRTPDHVFSEALPEMPSLDPAVPFLPTAAEAQRRLTAFLDAGIEAYGQQRNRLDVDGTSQLSPYLRFGMLSPRQAAVSAISARAESRTEAGRAGATTWLNELIWRDFYSHILYHFPFVARMSFRENLRDIAWRNDAAEFDAWCAGRTGYPVVDAAMRQLQTTGWMHNRARMIVASFLVKDLLIDWRWGEEWFMQHLIDGDPAANNGGWQWTAGTGTDAAPYFRIFNPTTQGQKFDPDGDTIRRWVPELAQVTGPDIHEPWGLTPLEQRTAGVIVGKDYPFPIVDHKIARERTLAAFAIAKETAA